MVQNNSIALANERLAQGINQQARQDPNSPYAGKFVGIANGQVVAVADSLRAAMERLRQVEPDPAKCFCLDASADYEQLDEIWRWFDAACAVGSPQQPRLHRSRAFAAKWRTNPRAPAAGRHWRWQSTITLATAFAMAAP